ncbi:hypothetical protein [Actinoplanes philippinensis]|uniref:hypothetical protein n=1 Tax=Actinoplanes philippinensis TaxID=35752 RepID=UPI0033DBA0B6
MSMHAIEDMAQGAVEVLDRHFPADDQRVRDWIVALSAFQDGYVDPPWLYCEAGSALWRRMAGPYAVPPRAARLLDVVVAVAGAAERDGDVELIALRWALGHQALVGGCPLSAEELAATPGVQELRATVRRTSAHQAKLWHDRRPGDDALDEMDDGLSTW